MESALKPVVFLDRDGVINEDRDDYVKNVDELVVFPYTPESIARLNSAGYTVVVVSNQQCVGKGMMTLAQLVDIEREINRQVNESGGDIVSFQYCTHLSSEKCSCRKPKAGMLHQAAELHHLDTGRGFIVGDNETDIIAGKVVGCRSVLVLSGMATRESVVEMKNPPDYVADDLKSAVDWILSQQ